MAECIVDGRFVPAGPWATRKVTSQVQHLKASFRTAEPHEERTPFGPDGDVANQAAARAMLLPAIGPRVVFHRLVFSPGPRFRLRSVPMLEEWTRAILGDLARDLGQQLIWVAAVHCNTSHAHVHVLLAGAAPRTRWPGKGSTTSVELRRGHYAFLKERADARAVELQLWADD